MKNVRSLMETIKTTYTFDEKMILLVFTSLFMPWWYAMAVISVCALYIFVKTDFMRMIKEVKGGSLLIGISLYCVLCCAMLSHSVMSSSLQPHGL